MAENQTLADMPNWMWVLIALGGLSGAMLDAHHAGVTGWELARRISLRLGGGVMVGFAVMLIMIATGSDALLAGGVGILVGVAGADVVLAMFLRWAQRRVDACGPSSK